MGDQGGGVGDDDVIVGLGFEVSSDAGKRGRQRADWTLVRCDCGAEASIPTEDLPIELSRPVRHEDGTRWGLCPRCQPKPNRAARRGK
jgi:hypothetical protein